MLKEILSTLVLSSACFAQSQPTTVDAGLKFDLGENLTIVNYKNSNQTLVEFLQGVDLKLNETFSVGLEIPVYFQGATDLGAINMSLDWNALVAESIQIQLYASVDTPMSNQFGASSVDPHLGGVFTYSLPWKDVNFVQTFDYEFVTNGTAWSLPFGTRVANDIISADSSITIPVWNSLTFGGTVWQNYTVANNGQQNILVGPSCKWEITDSVDLSGNVAVPVYQNVTGPKQNYVISASLGFNF
jgi:hypothetical protein